MKNLYPIYVISKGRWESRLTVKALQWMNVPFHVVVEPQEYSKYAAMIPAENIYTLPFSNLGQGSIPARNWVWKHSVEVVRAKRHWICDDNISGFVRLHDNSKIQVKSGTFFRVMEDWADRYSNVALVGPHYDFLAKRKQKLPPIYFNRRVYSCILINNELPFEQYQWRGRYNEDTDLTLRVLEEGLCGWDNGAWKVHEVGSEGKWCTALFLSFLACKAATLTMTGGNSSELYQGAKILSRAERKIDDQYGNRAKKLIDDEVDEDVKAKDGRWLMAKALSDQHPDISIITEKFGRWQHHVDYSNFKRNKLRFRDGFVVPEGENDYGLELRQIGEPR